MYTYGIMSTNSAYLTKKYKEYSLKLLNLWHNALFYLNIKPHSINKKDNNPLPGKDQSRDFFNDFAKIFHTEKEDEIIKMLKNTEYTIRL